MDKETQIERLDKELFDFDMQVEPLLEVLVAKTIEEAQVEIFEEERTKIIEEKMRDISVQRRAKLLMVQRKHYRRARYEMEQEKRRNERKKQYLNQLEVHKKLYTREFVKDQLKKGILADVGLNLIRKQILGQSNSSQIEMFFYSSVLTGGVRNMVKKDQKRSLLKKIMKEAMQKLEGLHFKIMMQKNNKEKREQQILEDAEKKRELEEKERLKIEEETKIRTTYKNMATKMLEELEQTKEMTNFSNSKKIQNINIWKASVSPEEESQFDIFGEGLNSLILLSIKAMEHKRRIMSKTSQNDKPIPLDFVEQEIIKNVITGMDKLTEKWTKSFAQLNYELPLNERLLTFFTNYEKILWRYLSIKEIVMNSKWPLESPVMDLEALEKEVLEYTFGAEDDESESSGILKMEHLLSFLVELDPERLREIILSYFFNTDNKVAIQKSGNPMKGLMDNIIRSEDFCKSQKLFNLLYGQIISQKQRGPVEDFLLENSIFTSGMWVEITQNLFKIRVNSLKRAFSNQMKKYKQDFKKKVNQAKKESKEGFLEMKESDFDFPQLTEYIDNTPFRFQLSRSKEEVLTNLSLPIIRIQYKLSSKRKQVFSEEDDDLSEPEPLVTPRFMKATLSKNLTLRSMASQVEKENTPRSKFQDEKKVNCFEKLLDLTQCGLQSLLMFKKGQFETMRIDPMELSPRQIEEMEKKNLFDGQTRVVKEEVFLPIHESVQDFLIWKNLWSDRIIINKKNQKLLLEILEKVMNHRVKVKGHSSVEIISQVENLFFQKVNKQSLIVFDSEF